MSHAGKTSAPPQLSDLGDLSLLDEGWLCLLEMVETWARLPPNVVVKPQVLVGLRSPETDPGEVVERVADVLVFRPRHARAE